MRNGIHFGKYKKNELRKILMLIFFLNVINFMIITPVIKQIHSTDVYVLSWRVCDFRNVSVRWHDMEQEKKLMNLD